MRINDRVELLLRVALEHKAFKRSTLMLTVLHVANRCIFFISIFFSLYFAPASLSSTGESLTLKCVTVKSSLELIKERTVEKRFHLYKTL